MEKLIKKIKSDKSYRNISEHEVQNDLVLVKPIDFEDNDGVIDPRQYEQKSEYGVVVNVGQGKILENGTRLPMLFKKGDFVVYNQYMPTKIRSLGEDLYFIHSEDILSKL